MKKITTILILFFTTVFYSQTTITTSFDVQNAFKGSDVNPKALDLKLRYLESSGAIEYGAVVEYFPEIKFYSYSGQVGFKIVDFVDINIFDKNYNESIQFVASSDIGRIGRYYPQRHAEFWYIAGNLEFRYFYGKFGLSLNVNSSYRTDQEYWNAEPKIVNSVFVGIIYILKVR